MLLAIPRTGARGYHVKGAAESIMTVAAITELTERLIGRHRPSFPPSLATKTAAVRRRRWRPGPTLAPWRHDLES
ncbi:MAG: hypothetical protein D6689_11660 [Deltaproteobacteria bacterium]|nr:MAG: hypothetical protein D6689_11660 [Deltaproteobacteria bacterium]